MPKVVSAGAQTGACRLTGDCRDQETSRVQVRPVARCRQVPQLSPYMWGWGRDGRETTVVRVTAD